MKRTFNRGQRWISELEPELGLGVVDRVEGRVVDLAFPATRERRRYAIESAQVKRVRFREGDEVSGRGGERFTVDAVEERDGLFVYRGEGHELAEDELCDTLGFDRPEQRLLAGQTDRAALFDLRRDLLEGGARSRRGGGRGFVGGRIDLIPHQLYIAHEVAARSRPRVLLSDEVGLGKTIEACLILHRLHRSGKAERVLILLPETLLHQWFVELLRRFNLWFSLFDEPRCEAIENGPGGGNPFEDSQLILCGLEFLAGSPRRREQAVAAGWDLLIVDEAHHLAWSPAEASPEYRLVEEIARETRGLLLLTASPEQLGQESHFARLRLLDPDRYHDYAAFREEAGRYGEVARAATRLVEGGALSAEDEAVLRELLTGASPDIDQRLAAAVAGDAGARARVVDQLLDQHGTGRILFRNTRAAMPGFPGRHPNLIPLDAEEAGAERDEALAELRREFASDNAAWASAGAGGTKPRTKRTYDLARDARVAWLDQLLRNLKGEKVLLICRTKEKALAVDAALKRLLYAKVALFHEDLPLVQRDRNAAWFAEEDGAQVLMCSEIGSEGRNFQFAHHLVLFDLPLDPELAEQRIGRLDRIGQTATIEIYLPFVEGSPQECLARWFHEGLDAIEHSLEGGNRYLEHFGAELFRRAMEAGGGRGHGGGMAGLLEDTREFRRDLTRQLEEGRDRLLELNSFRREVAEELVEDIARLDADPALEELMHRVFDHFGVAEEDVAERTYFIHPGHLTVEAFPGLPEDGLTVTYDRGYALAREDIGFLTWDHPMLAGAAELLLGSEQGTSSTAATPLGTPGLLLETLYVVEPVAPPGLEADRFLPHTPVRAAVDHTMAERGDDFPPEKLAATARDIPSHPLLEHPEVARNLLPRMLEAAGATAASAAEKIRQEAGERMDATLTREIERLVQLRAVNDHVPQVEIDALRKRRDELARRIADAPLRLDAVRLVRTGEPEEP